ncbi:MAG: hypothetical protein AABW80_00225 [Nanoarchaeota archaeon]
MPKIVKQEGFIIHQRRLAEVMQAVNTAVQNRYGIFRHGFKEFLPQWNLPEEMEFSPQQREPKDKNLAGLFLYTITSIDRISVSKIVQRQARLAWDNPEKRWIFFPQEVIKRQVSEIGEVLKENLFYNVPISKDVSTAQGYLNNARVMVDHFDGDPRNLVRYKTVSQARSTLMKLQGIGTGLANLLLMEYASRNIALPIDPENIRPKIDRHKARILINTNAVELTNHLKQEGKIHSGGLLVDALEQAYVETARQQGLSLLDIDAALWIIGSRICYLSNYHACLTNCPLVDGLCTANTQLNHDNGYFIVYDEKGKRVDNREKRDPNQPLLNFKKPKP